MAISAESGWVLPIAILITATMVATVPRIMTEHEALARREVRFADDMRDNSSLYQRTWRDYAGHELGEYDVVRVQHAGFAATYDAMEPVGAYCCAG